MPSSHVLASSDFNVRLLNAANGAQVWQFGPAIANTSCVVVKGSIPSDDHLYVGDSGGVIRKLRFIDGAQLSQIPVGGIVWGLAYAGDVIYANVGNTLQAHHAVNGHLWTHAMDDIAWGNPVEANGIVYAGSWDNKLHAINADGTTAWINSDFAFFGAQPVVWGGLVYAGSMAGDLVAMDAQTGQVIWQMQTSDGAVPVTPVEIANGYLYMATHWGGLYKMEAATGIQVWKTGGAGFSQGVTFWEDKLFIGRGYSISGDLRAFSADTGELLWTSQTPVADSGYAVSKPSVDQGPNTDHVFVTSGDGYAYGFNRDTGLLAWIVGIGSSMAATPTWTDAQGSIVPGGVPPYVTIDPLALRLSSSIYVKIKLPYPPPMEIVTDRVIKMAVSLNEEERQTAMKQLESAGSLIRSLQHAFTRIGPRPESNMAVVRQVETGERMSVA